MHAIPHQHTQLAYKKKKKTHYSKSNSAQNLKYIDMVYKSRSNLQVILSFGRRAVVAPPPKFFTLAAPINIIIIKITNNYRNNSHNDNNQKQ
jgi:hypothetical protein